MNIYIGNIPFNVEESELEDLFTEFGEVASVKILTDRFSGRSRGFGFIEMPDNSEADQAIKALNRSQLKGNVIKVNQSENKKKKRGRRGPRRFY